MTGFEYKVWHGPPQGYALMPWASQAVRDAVGRGSFEKMLNKLAAEGWEVISCSTAPLGNFFWISPQATVILRREKGTD